jgi:hypothetical protein
MKKLYKFTFIIYKEKNIFSFNLIYLINTREKL